MKKKSFLKKTMAAGMSAFILFAGNAAPFIAYAEQVPQNGWYEENGMKYWYENGIRQGTKGRGKEIYDPASDAWYWLDAVQNGAVAAGKDVYQESWAGPYADKEDGTGKWVRYDGNGHMIKGWQTTNQGVYYFDPVTGAMAKGQAVIDGKTCMFDKDTGIYMVSGSSVPQDGWYEEGGKRYWYENGTRQGTEGRGKEIYDPASNAWYWLDAVQDGAVAVSKDVYQESFAGKYADREDGTGKWVRYDANGHMVKGWNEKNGDRYYFDLETGAMVKGLLFSEKIKGENAKVWTFDKETGILIKEDIIEDVTQENDNPQEIPGNFDPNDPSWTEGFE